MDAYFLNFSAPLSDGNYETILKSQLRFDTLSVSNLQREIDYSALDPADPYHHRLAIQPKKIIFKQHKCSNHPDGIPSVSTSNIFHILLLNAGVKTLVFEQNSIRLSDFKLLENIEFRKLSRLEVSKL